MVFCKFIKSNLVIIVPGRGGKGITDNEPKPKLGFKIQSQTRPYPFLTCPNPVPLGAGRGPDKPHPIVTLVKSLV